MVYFLILPSFVLNADGVSFLFSATIGALLAVRMNLLGVYAPDLAL